MRKIDSRTFEKILRLRGCQHVRDKGGHSIWRSPDGAMIVAAAAGRSTPVLTPAIRNAAKTLGVSIDELLSTKKGPK